MLARAATAVGGRPLRPLPLRRPVPEPGGARRPPGARVAWEPFARCSLPTIRLLAGFALLTDEDGLARRLLLPPGREPQRPVCELLCFVVAAVRSTASARGAFDALLAFRLGRAASRFEGLSPAALARLWARNRETLSGTELAGLLWSVARRGDVALRPLEAHIARAVDVRRLVSVGPV